MSECENCLLEEKILNCCGKNPLSGETKKISLNGHTYTSCNYLNRSGECEVYESRPSICREYQCYKILERVEALMGRAYVGRMFAGFTRSKSKSSSSKNSRK